MHELAPVHDVIAQAGDDEILTLAEDWETVEFGVYGGIAAGFVYVAFLGNGKYI